MHLVLEIAIVLAAIVLGARYGSIAIGMAGGLGVFVLGLTGSNVKFEDIPFDVCGIIMAVIAAIAAVQASGGLTHLVYLTDKLLRKNPKYLVFIAPLVTYAMTVCAGTGHTAFSTLPVIAEVAKENNIRPKEPLSISVVASQLAICASPISAAVIALASMLEPKGISYLQILAVSIPSTLAATMVAASVIVFFAKPLADDPQYQQRVREGAVKPPPEEGSFANYVKPKGAVASLLIFLAAVVIVMVYATLISDQVGLIAKPTLPRNEAIISIMLGAAMIIVMANRVKPEKILQQQTFRSGMSAAICVMGVAWLGTTLINNHLEGIKSASGSLLHHYPWLIAVVLFFAAALLYSQASTTKALMPAALALGVSPLSALAAFPAVSALFILPTYPTLLAAVEFDDTGTTRIGKFVFNHPFIGPGTLSIALSVVFGYLMGYVVV